MQEIQYYIKTHKLMFKNNQYLDGVWTIRLGKMQM